jgi:hypothetical protein
MWLTRLLCTVISPDDGFLFLGRNMLRIRVVNTKLRCDCRSSPFTLGLKEVLPVSG